MQHRDTRSHAHPRHDRVTVTYRYRYPVLDRDVGFRAKHSVLSFLCRGTCGFKVKIKGSHVARGSLLSLCLSVSPLLFPFSLCPCLSVCLSSACQTISLSVSPRSPSCSRSPSVCLCVSVSVSLSLSVCLCLPLSLSRSH